MLRRRWALTSFVAAQSIGALCIAIGPCCAASAQDPKELVQQAVQAELNANANDHTHWLYFETDRKPESSLRQWVAETAGGDLERVLEQNGRVLSPQEQRSKMDSFIHDQDAQARKRKGNQHDDHQATEMLNMLPKAFVWTTTGHRDGATILHFKPDPGFHPPSYESRVLAGMEGEMTVDDAQHRIVSLKGQLIHDVKFGGGLFGELNAGGSFDVERRKTGQVEWQITETHVHIQGHALIFKNISEQEDDVKRGFEQLPENETFEQAEQKLLAAQKGGTDVASNPR